jgi:Taurine catabolism dioxygenase TauD, TfdA family
MIGPRIQFKDYSHELKSTGWTLLNYGWDTSIEGLKSIARQLGDLIPSRPGHDVATLLNPVDKEHRYKNSLTARFGKLAFPAHTDTAHWKTPARYIVLGCVNPGSGKRPTLLIPWQSFALSEKEIQLISIGSFLIRRRQQSFLSNITGDGSPFVRLDFNCMTEQNEAGARAKNLLQCKIGTSEPINIQWRSGMVLIIDNWTVLHSRGLAATPDPDRLLARILVTSARTV